MRFQDMWLHFFRSWSQRTKLQISTLCVLSGVFALISLSFLFYENFNELIKSLGQSFEMNVYLDSSLSKKNLSEIEKILKSKKEIESVKWISKEEALKVFSLQAPEEIRELLSKPEENPLPEHFQIRFKKFSLKSNQDKIMGNFYKEFSSLQGVESVSYNKSILKKYSSFLNHLYPFVFFLIFSLLMGGLFIVGNSIRGSLSQNKEEIFILKSMGSSIWHVSGPFIFEGIMMGLMSSFFSLVCTYIFFYFQLSFFENLFDFLPFGFELKYLNTFFLVSVLFLGILFGALGSYLCVREVYEEGEEMNEWEKEWKEA